jgi:ABC-type amino acid transport substrate-binding protein
LIFKEKSYGIALPVHSVYRDKINIALLELMEEGMYQELCDKWFGT